MARRLAVVVSQNPTGSLHRRHLEEALITQLLLESGLDLNIVPHVGQLTSDQTGLLCLEGIQGPMVLVCWASPAEALRALAAQGIHARLGRTLFSSSEAVNDTAHAKVSRVVYAIDLSTFENADPVSKEICRIRDDLATPTISLLGPGLQPINSSLPIVPTEPAPLEPPLSPAATVPIAARPTAARPTAARHDDEEDDDPALDRLVDMLDELDL